MSSSGRRFHRPYVSMVASSSGPLMLQDTRIIEELSHFNRERIPERVVHAKGSGAFGKFFLTKPIPQYTRAKIFTEVLREGVPIAVRFSTVGGEKGSADTVRDPRGFAVKFYTEEGNLDLVANNTPIFFINDPILFPSLVHSQKRNPETNLRDPDAYWDFLSSIPQSLHQVCYLHSDRGIPDGYRHMHGFACHTYQFTPDLANLSKDHSSNEEGPFYVKFHFKTQQGIKNLTSEEAEKLAGSDADYSTRDLFDSIKNGKFPKWTVAIQIMTEAQRLQMKENIFDITTTWSQKKFPLIEIGFFVLNENPTNHFTDIEQLAFCPSNLVPGIDPSPDRVLQGRIFAYADAQRYRLGVNFNDLRVNRSRCPMRDVTYRDGAGCATDNHGSRPNYYPNRAIFFPNDQHYQEEPFHIDGLVARSPPVCVPYLEQTRDFIQRVLDEPARKRLAHNLGVELNKVRNSITIQRMMIHFRLVSDQFANSIRDEVNAKRPTKPLPPLRPLGVELKELTKEPIDEKLFTSINNNSNTNNKSNCNGACLDSSAYKIALLAAGIESYTIE